MPGVNRNVLRFKAYYREGVHESQLETQRSRLCHLYYFIEDDSVAVVEPRQQNSGMNQGTIIKRHKVSGDNGPISAADLAVGSDVCIYGKVFRLYDCDPFTREFYASTGVAMPAAEAAPEATPPGYSTKGPPQAIAAGSKLSSGKTAAAGGSSATRQEVLQTTQFLTYDRKVLRFKAYWDEPTNTGPMRRLFHLYYFLSDDCFEVIEALDSNSGRDPFPSFVRRRKCPKVQQIASLTFKKDEGEYYTDVDLYLGQVLLICGKKFVLCDCDTFTRDHLMDKHGRTGDEVAKKDHAIPKKELPKPTVPPHNGFGDEDDSARSCKRLTAQCPVKDVRRYIEGGDQMLKFSLELVTDQPQLDGLRRFVLTYHVADGTLSVFEASGRNSGLIGGKFLQRQRVKLEDGTYAEPHMFYVGAAIKVSHRTFRVVSTDDRTVAYMESHSDVHKKSCINTVCTKLRCMCLSARCPLRATLLDNPCAAADYDSLLVLVDTLALPLVEQEVITLARYIARSKPAGFTHADLLAMLTVSDDGGTAEQVDEDWEVLHERGWAEAVTGVEVKDEELSKLEMTGDGRASQGMLKVLKAYTARRYLFQQELRKMCDRTRDCCVGAEEFKQVVENLHIDLTDSQSNEMCARLFPRALPRAQYREMLRIMEATSSYPHSAKTISRVA